MIIRIASCLLASLLLAACGGANKPEPAPEDVPAQDSSAKTSDVDPNVAKAAGLVELGVARFNNEEFDAALKLFEEAAELDPTSAGAHARLADILDRKGRLGEAKLAYRAAARLSPDAKSQMRLNYHAADVTLKLAQQKMKEGHYKLALEQARDALSYNPALSAARGAIAAAQFNLGDYEEARAEYFRVAEESTGEARQEALNWVGHCWLRLRNAAEAEKVFGGLINEGYTANNVYFWRGACRKERKDYQGARTDFLQAIEYANSKEMTADLQKELKAVDELLAKAGKSE
jgi:Flp pilus assembly protein TadD